MFETVMFKDFMSRVSEAVCTLAVGAVFFSEYLTVVAASVSSIKA
jgi:hypothetical protein